MLSCSRNRRVSAKGAGRSAAGRPREGRPPDGSGWMAYVPDSTALCLRGDGEGTGEMGEGKDGEAWNGGRWLAAWLASRLDSPHARLASALAREAVRARGRGAAPVRVLAPPSPCWTASVVLSSASPSMSAPACFCPQRARRRSHAPGGHASQTVAARANVTDEHTELVHTASIARSAVTRHGDFFCSPADSGVVLAEGSVREARLPGQTGRGQRRSH